MTEKLVTKISTAVARGGDTRRGFLNKMTIAGAAFAVGPVRFILYPDAASALAPSQCSGSRCNDGFHEFCCAVVGYNDCPSWTYHGGWWKCSAYTMGGLCSSLNQRYYIDCHEFLDGLSFASSMKGRDFEHVPRRER